MAGVWKRAPKVFQLCELNSTVVSGQLKLFLYTYIYVR